MRNARRSLTPPLLALVALVAGGGCGQGVATCDTICGFPDAPDTCASECGVQEASCASTGDAADFQAYLTCVGNTGRYAAVEGTCLAQARAIDQECGAIGEPLPDAGTPYRDATTTYGDATTGGFGDATGPYDAPSATGEAGLPYSDGGAPVDSGVFDPGAGDGVNTCTPPSGGETCTPGAVACGAGTCDLATQYCCVSTDSDSEACISNATACAGRSVRCNEAADCPGTEICCLDVTNTAGGGSMSCQVGPTCRFGSGIASAQVCRSSGECASGSCSLYSCSATAPATVLESCDPPAGLIGATCTKL